MTNFHTFKPSVVVFIMLINVTNANNCWHCNINENDYISCSVELSMKEVLYPKNQIRQKSLASRFVTRLDPTQPALFSLVIGNMFSRFVTTSDMSSRIVTR